MNAVAAHAVAHGSTLPPVVSPWHLMLADRNPATVVPSRQSPPPGSGLVPASSEIHDVGILQRAGFPVVPYTINDPARMTELLDLGVDGLISDDPAALYDAIARYDPDGDGFGGDYLLPDGRPDPAQVDAQGQRGGRDLRPENTLPAMEVALDHRMTTLGLDVGVTADKLPILSHDPMVTPEKCRRADGGAVPADGTLIRDLTAAELQAGYVCDVLLPDHPRQTNNRALSPVSQAFAAERGLVDPYVPPTLAQVYGFIGFYEHWYATGLGRALPDAAVRAATAAAIRLNVETRLNPRTAYNQRTLGPDAVTAAVLDTVRRAGAVGRTSLQSFDWRTLLMAQEREPALQTVYLFGDFPAFDDPGVAGSGEGGNLQGEHGTTSPWLAGLSWPYRVTTLSYPDRVRGTGGLEGTAITTDGSVLLAMLEKPLDGDPTDLLWIHEFSMSEGSFTGRRFGYRLDPRGVSAGDFQLVSDTTGLVVERDASEGDLAGHKAVYEILLSAPGFDVAKRRVVDLLALANPDGVGGAGAPGDVGLGEPFAFPFETIESVIVLGPDRIGVLNDNNFPDSVGRHVGARRPDDNEFIVVQLAQPLATP
jgi:glycerophosphoryl diester phosphodiesterase